MGSTSNQHYNDIIDLTHHISTTRPRMSMLDRAAQFSPFAALTGYDAAIKETGRLTGQRIELTEECRTVLDRKQQVLLENLAEHPEVSVTYFVPDERKSGGAYETITGNLRRIDEVERFLVMVDGRKIPLDDIVNLESDVFPSVLIT